MATSMKRGELLAIRHSLMRCHLVARERADHAAAIYNSARLHGLEADDLERDVLHARLLEATYSRAVIRLGNEAISKRP